MRRWHPHKWIALLVALLVPLQFATVAIAAYCQHEHALEQQAHFGHHNHDHDANVSHEEGSASDHSNCDLSYSLSLKVSVRNPMLASSPPAEQPAAAPPTLVARDLPDPLYRPPLARCS